MPRLPIALAALLAAAPLVATADAATVTVGHDRLEPARVEIAVGESVTFHNVDAMPGGHTVAADDGSFRSPPLAEDERWSHAFERPGRYPIHIVEHPGARAEIVVAE